MVDIIFASAGVAFFAFCVLMVARNEIVFRCINRRIDEVYSFNMAQIRKGDIHRLSKYDYNYTSMMWEFRKWTYKQFFPCEVK